MKRHPIYEKAAKAWAAKPGSSVYIDTAEGARLIRDLLKRKFPGTKFSVRISRYAGGSSTRISWTDGPTDKLVDAYVSAFAGSDFDGMIDLKYSSSSWLYPDGSASFAATGGTEGSGGVRPASAEGPAADGAIPVRFGSDYVFTERRYSAGALERVLLAYSAKWRDELAEAIDAGKVRVMSDAHSAWLDIEGSPMSVAPVGATYGARSVLYNMAGRRMLPDAIPVAA